MEDWKAFIRAFVLCLILIQVEGQDYLYRSHIQPHLPPYRSTRYPPRIPYYPPQGYNPYLQHQRRYDNIRNYGTQYQLPSRRISSQPIASSIVPPSTFLPSSTTDLQRSHPASSSDISKTPLLSQNANVQVTSYGDINTDTSTGSETQIRDTYNYSIRRDDNDDSVKVPPYDDVSDAQIYFESSAKYIPVNEDDGDFHQNAHENSDSHRSSASKIEFQMNNDTTTQVQTSYKSHSTAPDFKSDEIVKDSNGADDNRKGQSTGADNTNAHSMGTDKDETEKEEKNSNGYSEIKDVEGKKIQRVGTPEIQLNTSEIRTLFSEESPAKYSFVIAPSTEKSIDDINQTALQPQRQWNSEIGITDEMTEVNENDTEKEFSNIHTISSTSERKDVCCNDGNSESGYTDKQETTHSSTQDEVHYKSVVNSSSELEKDGTADEQVKKHEEVLMAGETVDPKISHLPLQHAHASEQVQEPIQIEYKNLSQEVKDSYTSKDMINKHTEEGYVGNEMYKEKEEIFIIDDSPVNEQMQGPHKFLHHIMDEQTQKPYNIAEHQADETQDLEFKQKDALDEPATEPQVVKDNKDDLSQDPLHLRSHLTGDQTPENHEDLPQYTVVQEAQRAHKFSEQTPYRPTASKTVSDPSESNLEKPLPDKIPSHTLQHSPEYVESSSSHHSSPLNPVSPPGTRIPLKLYPAQTQFLQPYPGRNHQRLPSLHAKNSTSIPLGPTNPQHSQQTSTPLLLSQNQSIFQPASVSAPNLPSHTPSIPPPQFNTTFYPQSPIYKSLHQPPPQLTFHRSPASQQHSSPSLHKDMNHPAPSRFPSNRHPVLPFPPQNHRNPNIHQQQLPKPPSNIHQPPTAYSHPQSSSELSDAHKSLQTVPPPNTYQQFPNTEDPLVRPDTVFYRSQHPPPFHTLMSPSGQFLYPALGPVPGPPPVVHIQSPAGSPEKHHLPRTHYFQVRTISDQDHLPKYDQKSNNQELDFSRKELSSKLHEGGSEGSYGEHFSSQEDGLKSQGTFSFSHNIHPQNSQINTRQTPLRRSQEVPLYHPPASHQLVDDTSIYQSPGEQSLHKQSRQQNYHPRHQQQHHLSPQQHNFLQPEQNPPAYHNEDNLSPYFPVVNSTHFTLTPKQSASDFPPPTRIHLPQPINSKQPSFQLRQPRPQVETQRTKLPPPVVMAEDNLKIDPDLAKSQVEVLPQFNPASKRVFRLNANPFPQKESIENKAPNDDPFTIISGPSSYQNEEQIDSPVSEILILTSEDNKTNLASDKNPALNEDQSENLSPMVLDVNETRKDNLLTHTYDSSLSSNTTEATSSSSVRIATPGSFPYTSEVGSNNSAVILEDDFIHAVPISGSNYHETDINKESKLQGKGISSLTYTQNQQDSKSQNKEEITSPANIEKAAKLTTQGSNKTANEDKEIHAEHKGTGYIINYDDFIHQSSKTPKNYTNQHNKDITGNTNRSQPTIITSHSDKSLSDNTSPGPVPNKKDRPFIIPSAHANPFRPFIIPKNILHQHKQPQPPEEAEQPYTIVPLQSHNETSKQQKLPFPSTPQTNSTHVIHQNLLKELTSNSPVSSHALPIKPLIEKSQQELPVPVINAQQSSLEPNTHAGDKQIQEHSMSYQDQQIIIPQLHPIPDEPQPSTQELPSQPHLILSLQNLPLQPTEESSQISSAQLQSSDFPSTQVKVPPLKQQLQSGGTSLIPHSTLHPLTNLKPHQQNTSSIIQTNPVIIHPHPPQPSLLPQLPSNTQTVDSDESFKIHLSTKILPYTPSEEDKFHLPGRDIVNHGIYVIPDNATEVRSDADVTKKSKAGEVMHESLDSLPDFLKDAIVIDNSLAEPLQVKMSKSYGKVTYN